MSALAWLFTPGFLLLLHQALVAEASTDEELQKGDNQSTTSFPKSFPDLDPVRAVATALPLVLIVFCTVCGNMLVLLAVLTTRKLRTATNYFIVNLAIADMMLGITVLPFSTTIEILDERWIFGQALCDMWVTIDVLCCTASIYGLCVISIDRYIGVSKPLVHHQIVNKHRAILINAGVWLLAAAICVVPFFGWRKSLDVEAMGVCEVNENKAYVIFSAMCSFFLPCTIVVIVYWRIYLKAVQQTRFMKLGYKEAKLASGENGVVLRIHTGVQSAAAAVSSTLSTQRASSGSASKRNSTAVSDLDLRQRKIDWTKFKRERRAARTLGIVVGVFIACWVPFFLILPINAFCDCLPADLFKVVFWLGYCNSLMNPFIYGADSRDFQMAFKRLLCGKSRSISITSNTSNNRLGRASVTTVVGKTRNRMSRLYNDIRGSAGQCGRASFAVQSTLPTTQEDDMESYFSDCTAVMGGKSTTSIARALQSNVGTNGLLTVPCSASVPAADQPATEPLLSEPAGVLEISTSQEVLVVSPRNSEVSLLTKGISRHSISGTTEKIAVEEAQLLTDDVATSTTSLSMLPFKTSPPTPAPIAELEESESEIISYSQPDIRKESVQLTQTPIHTNTLINEEESLPTKAEKPGRVASTSSLSSISSPSDSDDEEVKRKKRAARERRKKNFLSRKSSKARSVWLHSLSKIPHYDIAAFHNALATISLRKQDQAVSSPSSTIMNKQRSMSLDNMSGGGNGTRNNDDIASLAFRRLIMVRFARRMRARSKTRGEVPAVGVESPPASEVLNSINDSSASEFKHSFASQPAVGIGSGVSRPLSKWQTAISRMTSSATIHGTGQHAAVAKKHSNASLFTAKLKRQVSSSSSPKSDSRQSQQTKQLPEAVSSGPCSPTSEDANVIMAKRLSTNTSHSSSHTESQNDMSASSLSSSRMLLQKPPFTPPTIGENDNYLTTEPFLLDGCLPGVQSTPSSGIVFRTAELPESHGVAAASLTTNKDTEPLATSSSPLLVNAVNDDIEEEESREHCILVLEANSIDV